MTFTFNFLAKHIHAFPKKYSKFENFLRLYRKHFTLPYGVCQRYAFALYSPDQLLEGDINVCMGKKETCTTWKRIVFVRGSFKIKKASMDDIMFLSRLGRVLKFCGKSVFDLYHMIVLIN